VFHDPRSAPALTPKPAAVRRGTAFLSNRKTVGEWLHVERIEADLSQAELAGKSGNAERRVQAWEHDKAVPTETECRTLAEILPLDTGIPLFAIMPIDAPLNFFD